MCIFCPGFKKVDYVTNISVPSPGVLDPTAGSPSVTYRVNWNVDKRVYDLIQCHFYT